MGNSRGSKRNLAVWNVYATLLLMSFVVWFTTDAVWMKVLLLVVLATVAIALLLGSCFRKRLVSGRYM